MPIKDFIRATGGDTPENRIASGAPSRVKITTAFGQIVWQQNSGVGPGGNVYDDEEMETILDAVECLSHKARARLQRWIYQVKVAFHGRVV